jgi:hypothetical protein
MNIPANCCLLELRKVRAKLVDSASAVANMFRKKVLVGEVLVVGMYPNTSTFEKRTVLLFFESLNT